MAEVEDFVPPLIKAGMLEFIAPLLRSPSPLAQVYGIGALLNFSRCLPAIPELIAAGLLQGVVELLSSTDPKIKRHSAGFIYNLCLDRSCTGSLLEAGIIPPLLEIVGSEWSSDAYLNEARGFATDIISQLAEQEPARPRIAENGGIFTLVDLVNSPDIALAGQAAGIIAKLSDSPALVEKLAAAGSIHPLVNLLGRREEWVLINATEALRKLTDPADHVRKAVSAGALPLLIHMLGDNSPVLQNGAAEIINNISDTTRLTAAHSTYNHLVVSEGAIPPLIRLMRSDLEEVAGTAACAVLSNMEHPPTRRAVVDSRAFPAYVSALNRNSEVLQGYAAKAMQYFALEKDIRSAIRAQGVVHRLQQLRISTSEDLRSDCVAALEAIAAPQCQ